MQQRQRHSASFATSERQAKQERCPRESHSPKFLLYFCKPERFGVTAKRFCSPFALLLERLETAPGSQGRSQAHPAWQKDAAAPPLALGCPSCLARSRFKAAGHAAIHSTLRSGRINARFALFPGYEKGEKPRVRLIRGEGELRSVKCHAGEKPCVQHHGLS